MPVARFADGGSVAYSNASESTARGMKDFATSIGTQVSTNTNFNIALVGNQQEAMEQFMRSNKGQRVMLDFSKNNARFSSSILGNI